MNQQENSAGGFKSLARRGLDSTDREARRTQVFQEIKALLKTATPNINRVYPEPLQQQSSDTCLFACLISVKKAMDKSEGRTYLGTESSIANLARAEGVLENGGAHGNEATVDFIKRTMNLDLEIVGGTPLEKTQAILDALQRGDFPLLAYSLGGRIDHWVVVAEVINRGKQITVVIMNPFKGQSHEGIDDDEFSKRVMHGYLTDNPISSGLMIAKKPRVFQVRERRPGS